MAAALDGALAFMMAGGVAGFGTFGRWKTAAWWGTVQGGGGAWEEASWVAEPFSLWCC